MPVLMNRTAKKHNTKDAPSRRAERSDKHGVDAEPKERNMTEDTMVLEEDGEAYKVYSEEVEDGSREHELRVISKVNVFFL